MKTLLPALLLLLLPALLCGQAPPPPPEISAASRLLGGQALDPACERLLRQADSLFAEREYDKALKKYNSAKVCAPAEEAAVNEKIEAVFQRILGERDAAKNVGLVFRTVPEDPTLALRIAGYNWRKHPDNSVAFIAFQEVLTDTQHVFYKNLPLRSFASAFAVSSRRDKNYWVTANADHTAAIWSMKGELKHLLEGHADVVNAVAISPADAKFLVTASSDHTAKVWNDTGSLVLTLEGHSAPLRSVAISPDGERVATASDDGEIRLWRLGISNPPLPYHEARQPARLQLLDSLSLGRHDGRAKTVAFSPAGDYLASTGDDLAAVLWRFDGSPPDTLPDVEVLDISPSGTLVATGSPYGTASLWTSSGQHLLTLDGHDNRLTAIRFSPDDSTYLATASMDGTAKLWSLSDGGRLLQTLKGHDDGVSALALSTAKGDSILTCGWDGSVKLWDSKGRFLRNFKGHEMAVFAAVFYGKEKLVLTASDDHTVKMWSHWEQTLHLLKDTSDAFSTVACSKRDLDLIVTGGENGTVAAWNFQGLRTGTFKGHRAAVTSAAISPKGDFVLTGSLDNTAIKWASRGLPLDTLRVATGSFGGVTAVGISPQGDCLATGYADLTARLWSSQGEPLHLLGEQQHGTAGVTAVAFSPTGDTLAVAGGWSAALWSKTSGKLLLELPPHGGEVTSIGWSPAGDLLVTGSRDRTAKIWSAGGKLLHTCRGHGDEVTAAAFSPKSLQVITLCADGSAHLWTPQGELLDELDRSESWGSATALSPDGDFAVTATDPSTTALRQTWQLFLREKTAPASPADLLLARVELDERDFQAVRECPSPDTLERVALHFEEQEKPDLAKEFFLKAARLYRASWSEKTMSAKLLKKIIALSKRTSSDCSGELKSFLQSDRPAAEYEEVGGALKTEGWLDDSQKFLRKAREAYRSSWLPGEPSATQFLKFANLSESVGLEFEEELRQFLQNESLPEQLAYVGDQLLRHSQQRRTPSPHHHQKEVQALYEKALSLHLQAVEREGGVSAKRMASVIQLSEKTELDYASLLAKFLDAAEAPDSLERVGGLLRSSGDTAQAVPVFKKALKLRLASDRAYLLDAEHFLFYLDALGKTGFDYSRGLNAILSQGDPKQIWKLVEHFNRRGGDPATAGTLYNRLLELEDSPETRLRLYHLRRQAADDSLVFRQLFFPPDPAKRKQYFFHLVDRGKGSNEEMRVFYKNLLLLAENVLADGETVRLRQQASRTCNNLGWFQLLTADSAADFKKAEAAIRRGIELDADNLYLYTNLPPALLFQGRFDEAKAEYLKWKDKPYIPERFPYFFQVFLKDLDVFENEGVIPGNCRQQVDEIRKLLE